MMGNTGLLLWLHLKRLILLYLHCHPEIVRAAHTVALNFLKKEILLHWSQWNPLCIWAQWAQIIAQSSSELSQYAAPQRSSFPLAFFFFQARTALLSTAVFEMFGALPLMNTWHATLYEPSDSSLSKFIGMYAVWFDKLFCFAFHHSQDIGRKLPVYLRHHLSKIRLRREQIKCSKNLLSW